MPKHDYYVYERFRKDNNTCFYVGRGHGDRIYYLHRNDKHDEICKTVGYYNIIYKSGLTSEEASQLEMERIKYYVDELNYGIDISGYMDRDKTHYLTNRTFGGEDGYFKNGKLNQQYGVSPKDRMGSHYDEWYQKASQRCKNQIGALNPNYGNDTLHNIVKDNPELRIQWYSRKGGQNGRAKGVKLLDDSKNLIKEFSTIGECCQYLIDNYNVKAKVDSMRTYIVKAIKEDKTYKGFRYEFV